MLTNTLTIGYTLNGESHEYTTTVEKSRDLELSTRSSSCT